MISADDERRYFQLNQQHPEIGKDVADKLCAFGEVVHLLFADPYAKVADDPDHYATTQLLLRLLDPQNRQARFTLPACGHTMLIAECLSDPGEPEVAFRLQRQDTDGLLNHNGGLIVTVRIGENTAHLVSWLYFNDAARKVRWARQAVLGAHALYAKLQAKGPVPPAREIPNHC